MRGNNRERARFHLNSFLAIANYAKASEDPGIKKIVKKSYWRMRISLGFDIGLAKKDGLENSEAKKLLAELRQMNLSL